MFKKLLFILLIISSVAMFGCDVNPTTGALTSTSLFVQQLCPVIENITEDNGGIKVNIQDQTTRMFDIPLNQILDNTTYSISTIPVINTYDIILNSTIGLTSGDKIAFLEQNGMEQIYFGQIISILSNTITLNAPVPYNFTPANTAVFTFDNQLNVDGSINAQTFSLCNFFNEDVDITRIIFACTENSEMHDGLFCSENQLTRGLEFRKLTKHGVVIRLEPLECIEALIQDDLTGISSASLIAEGHFTQN